MFHRFYAFSPSLSSHNSSYLYVYTEAWSRTINVSMYFTFKTCATISWWWGICPILSSRPPSGMCHPKQKKITNARGLAQGGIGAAEIDCIYLEFWLWDNFRSFRGWYSKLRNLPIFGSLREQTYFRLSLSYFRLFLSPLFSAGETRAAKTGCSRRLDLRVLFRRHGRHRLDTNVLRKTSFGHECSSEDNCDKKWTFCYHGNTTEYKLGLILWGLG